MLGLRIRIPPEAWKSVFCQCCVLSGWNLCDGPIPFLGNSYRLLCVIVCDLYISKDRRSWPEKGCYPPKKKDLFLAFILYVQIYITHTMSPTQYESFHLQRKKQATKYDRKGRVCFTVTNRIASTNTESSVRMALCHVILLMDLYQEKRAYCVTVSVSILQWFQARE
jgi:hypothetical protein